METAEILSAHENIYAWVRMNSTRPHIGQCGKRKLPKNIEKSAFMLAYGGILWYTYFCGGVKSAAYNHKLLG